LRQPFTYIPLVMTSPDSERERQRLAEVYAGKTNEELTSLAGEGGSLTDLARVALQRKLSRRRLYVVVRESSPLAKAPDLPSLVTAHQFLTVQEAIRAKSILDSAGIESFLADDNLASMNWLWSNALGRVKLQVRKTDTAIALNLLNQKPDEAAANTKSDETANE
jgi:hypothetical protein